MFKLWKLFRIKAINNITDAQDIKCGVPLIILLEKCCIEKLGHMWKHHCWDDKLNACITTNI